MGLEDPVDLVEGEELSLVEKLQRLPSLLRTLFALQSQFRRLPRSVAGFLADFLAAGFFFVAGLFAAGFFATMVIEWSGVR